MDIQLVPLDTHADHERQAFAEFVNKNYKSQLPMEESSLSAEAYHFYWAKAGKTAGIVGVTGFVTRTPFLAETIKTVIDPEFRGQGLGMTLSKLIEDEVRRKGFKKVMSTIYIDNLPMIFIKLKQGYRFEGFHPDHEKPGLHEYSLGKILK